MWVSHKRVRFLIDDRLGHWNRLATHCREAHLWPALSAPLGVITRTRLDNDRLSRVQRAIPEHANAIRHHIVALVAHWTFSEVLDNVVNVLVQAASHWRRQGRLQVIEAPPLGHV